MKAATTLPRLLQRNAADFGRQPAFREKRGGIWQVTSWADYASMASRLAAGFARQGIRRGDHLVVIGDNRPSLYAALLAAQSIGGVGVPLSPDAEPDWIARVIGDARATVAVAEDAEQVDKIVAVKDRLPGLRLVVQMATHGMRQASHAWLTSFEAIAVVGSGVADLSESGDPALLLYPDGTRGTTLSHASLIAAADSLMAADPVHRGDETMAWLPMSWFADVLSQALALSAVVTCNCPETPDTVWRDLREIGPTVLIAPLRIWEAMLADIETRSAQATPTKRALCAGFRALAERAEQHRTAARHVSLLMGLKLALGNALVYAPMRDQIGLRRLRWASSGGETLSPRVLHAFRAIGVNLKQGFGVPELAIAEGEPAHA